MRTWLRPAGRRWALGALAAVGLAAPSVWAAMTVYDPSVNASVLNTHAEAVRQLEELQKQYAQLQRMYTTLGQGGVIGRDFGGGLLRESARLSGIALDVEGWDVPRDFTIGALSAVDSGTDALQEVLSAIPDELGSYDGAETNRARDRRTRIHEDAAYHAMALAFSERNALPQAVGRASTLASEAQTSVDLHSDLVAANKLQVATLENMIAIRATLAALLELQGSESLRAAPMIVRGQADPIAAGSAGGDYRLGE